MFILYSVFRLSLSIQAASQLPILWIFGVS